MAPNKSEYEKLLPEIRALTDEVVRQNMADGVLWSRHKRNCLSRGQIQTPNTRIDHVFQA